MTTVGRAEFNHVWFVVQPLKVHGATHYRVAVACKEGVGEFGAPLLCRLQIRNFLFSAFPITKVKMLPSQYYKLENELLYIFSGSNAGTGP